MTAPQQPSIHPGGTAQLAGRPVARIGFGAMQLPGPGVMGPPPDRHAALAVLRRAVDLGVNHVDTAQFYGPEVANELIREALHPYPDDLVLVSKVGATRDERGRWLPAQRPEELRAGVEDNLRTLGVERIDVVNLRRHDEDAGVDLDAQLTEMATLRDEGKIGAIGLSNVTVEQFVRALPAGIACVQNAYSYLDRSGQDLFERCTAEDVPWVPFFPLGSAFPGKPKVTEHPAVLEAAVAVGVTPAQVGLAWLLAQGPTVLLIPGTSSVAHLEDNVAAGDVHLDGTVLAALDAAVAWD